MFQLLRSIMGCNIFDVSRVTFLISVGTMSVLQYATEQHVSHNREDFK